LIVLPAQLGRLSWTVKRPELYCDADNPQWPEVATLQLTMPTTTMNDAQLRELVTVELGRLEAEAQQEMARKGWRFLGPQRVLAASPYDRAKSWEPLRSRNPSFAIGRGQRETFFETVTVLREFRKAYHAALRDWRTGLRNALFPVGTWLMRCLHSADVAS
jgi:putative transposase